MKLIKVASKFLSKKEVRSLKALNFVIEFLGARNIGSRFANQYMIYVKGC